MLLLAHDCAYFTKLDINSAFWAVLIREKDRQKTGFITYDGPWQWACLPLGLRSSPAIFQRILRDVIVENKLDKFAINYIDNILIFSENLADHLINIEKTLAALEKADFKLNKKKMFVREKFSRVFRT